MASKFVDKTQSVNQTFADDGPKYIMKWATNCGVDIYSPNGILYREADECVTIYKPLTSDNGFIYVQTTWHDYDVMIIAHVVVHHELKLVGWGHGLIHAYILNKGAVQVYDLPTYTPKLMKRYWLAEDLGNMIKRRLKELYTGYKIVSYTHKFHEQMKAYSMKKVSALGNQLPLDIIIEIANALAPSWVYNDLYDDLDIKTAWQMNEVHKDFVWHFENTMQYKKKKRYGQRFNFWHVAYVPSEDTAWKWCQKEVAENVYMPVLGYIREYDIGVHDWGTYIPWKRE